VPFGYLEFSRAIKRKSCPRERGGWLEPGSSSGSLPGPVPESAQRLSENRCEQLGGCCLKRRLGSDHFTAPGEQLSGYCLKRRLGSDHFTPPGGLFITLRFSQIKHTNTEINLLHSEVRSLQLSFNATSNRKWEFCNSNFKATFNRF